MAIEYTSRNIPKAQEVVPLKNIKDITRVKNYFISRERYRDYMMFVVGINVGLRASDLLVLKIADVIEAENSKWYKLTDEVSIIEKKTNKSKTFTLNESAKEAIALYLGETYPQCVFKDHRQNLPLRKMKKNSEKTALFYDLPQNDYLFRSNKGVNKPIRVDTAHRIIKSTMRDLGIKGNYGTHSMRKTFGYYAFTNNVRENPRILQELQKLFNHSSELITLSYIGITKDSIINIYNSVNL